MRCPPPSPQLKRFDVVYNFLSILYRHRVMVRARAPFIPNDPSFPLPVSWLLFANPSTPCDAYFDLPHLALRPFSIPFSSLAIVCPDLDLPFVVLILLECRARTPSCFYPPIFGGFLSSPSRCGTHPMTPHPPSGFSHLHANIS